MSPFRYNELNRYLAHFWVFRACSLTFLTVS
ncbi:hypothetical protein D5018_11980 [Parashewanella curva]|uniref:Uncharacterized protein n=1 Tax=Parashewanella curva TaxID=2338552 RepID=A0A3L8PXH3_9GAMM|nr:hypothetical protein D5018_11980 [Parashewanella curva]